MQPERDVFEEWWAHWATNDGFTVLPKVVGFAAFRAGRMSRDAEVKWLKDELSRAYAIEGQVNSDFAAQSGELRRLQEECERLRAAVMKQEKA